MKLIAGALFIAIARGLIMVGIAEIYLLAIGELQFKEGRQLRLEYGLGFIFIGCLISYYSWNWFEGTTEGWTRVPHQSAALVSAIMGLLSIFYIADEPNVIRNYFLLILAAIVVASWWYRTKRKSA